MRISPEDIIRILSIQNVGPRKTLDLYEHFGSLENIFKASVRDLLHVPGIHEKTAVNILAPLDPELLRGQMLLLEKFDVSLLTIWDSAYPTRLKEIYDPPIALFARGDISLLHNGALAIVGTRAPSGYGRVVTQELAQGLVENGYTLVSGAARGIDTIVHETCLQNSGKTIAVLGNGVDRVYPSENRPLLERIRQQGLLVSEFLMGAKPDAPNFPRRNRIISGLTLGTLVIEAAEKSGSLITAYYALDQNREVFAVPGSIRSTQSQGTHQLIRQGAKLVGSVEDILVEYGDRYKMGHSQGQQELLIAQDPESTAILKHLSFYEQLHIDDLAERCGQTTFSLLATLLQLEMKGLIQQHPGKYFTRK